MSDDELSSMRLHSHPERSGPAVNRKTPAAGAVSCCLHVRFGKKVLQICHSFVYNCRSDCMSSASPIIHEERIKKITHVIFSLHPIPPFLCTIHFHHHDKQHHERLITITVQSEPRSCHHTHHITVSTTSAPHQHQSLKIMISSSSGPSSVSIFHVISPFASPFVSLRASQ